MKANHLILTLLSAVAMATGLSFATTQSSLMHDVVVISGEPAPGASGTVFRRFDDVQINTRGDIAFRTTLDGAGVDATNDVAAFLLPAQASPQLRIREGDPATGSSDVRELRSTVLDGVGGLAFDITLANPLNQPAVLRREIDRPLELLGVEGSFGLVQGETNTRFTELSLINASDNGSVYVFSRYTASFGPRTAILVEDPGPPMLGSFGLRIAARTNSSAPGLAPGVRLNDLLSVVVRDNEQIGFVAQLSDNFGAISASNDTAVFRDRGNGLSAVAQEGDPVHGLPPGITYGDFSSLELSETGESAFIAALNGAVTADTDAVIVSEVGSQAPRVMARKGDLIPDMDGETRFVGFTHLQFDGIDRLIVLATLGGPAVTAGDDEALLVIDSIGRIKTVVREGDPLTNGLPKTLAAFGDVQSTRDGLVVFAADLSGGGFGDRGLFMATADGSTRPIILEGDIIDRPGGEFRTVNEIKPTFDVSRQGEVVHVAAFSDDGEEAVLRTALPERQNTADVSLPLGLLDQADVLSIATCPPATTTAPTDTADVFDVLELLRIFDNNCP